MADKNSFILYIDEWESIEELSIEQRGVLLTAIYAVNNDGVIVPDMDQPTRIVFKAIRRHLLRDAKKYDEVLEKRRSAGRLGGKASGESRRNKTKQTKQVLESASENEANEADSVSDSVSDSDSVSVSDSEGPSALDDTHGYGTLRNVELTVSQHQEIIDTYQNAQKLINKVSVWIPEAAHPVKDHFALVHRFAINDDWPKKPSPEPPSPPPDPERGEFMPMPDDIRKKMDSTIGGM